MTLTRRQFLTLMGGSAAGAILFQACGIPEEEMLVQSPLEMPEDMVTGIDNWYATLCRQCATCEGVVVRVMEGRAKKVEGNVDYPINRGKHSVRCEAGLQALYHPDRIMGPLVRVGDRGSGKFEEISWTDAIGRLTYQLGRLQSSGEQSKMVMATGPVGAHLGKVIDNFVSKFGGRHLPYEPLESTNLNAAMKQVFNQDVMPDFDIDNSKFVLSFGADFLNTWMSPVRYARGYGAFRQGEGARGKLVHVDSRFSMTAANADEWIYVKPGMEGVLALSIAQVIISEKLAESNVVNALLGGDLSSLDDVKPETVEDKIGVSADTIKHIAREFAHSGPSLAIGGGSSAAHTNGSFNMAAIYSLNYLVGSVGKPGGIIFNPSSPIDDIPVAPKTAPFNDWRQLVDDAKQGKLQVLMLRGADPWYGLPDSVGFKDATYDVPFIFSFSGFMDDTTSMSDLILPEHNYLEDWGSDIPVVGPGYQVVGFQQPVVRPFFESRGVHLGTRNVADVLMTIAQGIDLDLELPGETFKDILKDSANKLFDMNRGSVRAGTSESFWNGILQRGGWWDTSAKYTGVDVTPPKLPKVEEPSFGSQDTGSFPLHLIPFSSVSMDDGKGAHLPWLQATPDPVVTATWQTWVEININLAKEIDVKEGDVVKVVSAHGTIEALAYPHPGISPDVVSIPVGQGHRASGRYAQGRGSNVLSILAPLPDSTTGALAWAATRVRLEKTNRWIRLPKFENTVPDLPVDENNQIIQLTQVDV